MYILFSFLVKFVVNRLKLGFRPFVDTNRLQVYLHNFCVWYESLTNPFKGSTFWRMRNVIEKYKRERIQAEYRLHHFQTAETAYPTMYLTQPMDHFDPQLTVTHSHSLYFLNISFFSVRNKFHKCTRSHVCLMTLSRKTIHCHYRWNLVNYCCDNNIWIIHPKLKSGLFQLL